MANRAVAVIGMGPVGRSWLRVFTRAGFPTRIWDADPEQLDAGWSWLKADLKLARKLQGLRKAVARSQRELVERCESLEEAVAGAAYVQECCPDRLDVKRKSFTAIDRATGPRTIIATSSASFDLAQVTANVEKRGACVIAHPVGLPHVLPAVEVCPGPETEPAAVRRTARFMVMIGQEPVVVRRFVAGLVGDRLRAALLREALHLVAEEIADPSAVEKSVEQGLGMLWAVSGPFRAICQRGDGGLRDHLTDKSPAYKALWRELATTVELTPPLIEGLARNLDGARGAPSVEDQQLWRDEMVERIRRLKVAHSPDGPVED